MNRSDLSLKDSENIKKLEYCKMLDKLEYCKMLDLMCYCVMAWIYVSIETPKAHVDLCCLILKMLSVLRL